MLAAITVAFVLFAAGIGAGVWMVAKTTGAPAPTRPAVPERGTRSDYTTGA